MKLADPALVANRVGEEPLENAVQLVPLELGARLVNQEGMEYVLNKDSVVNEAHPAQQDPEVNQVDPEKAEKEVGSLVYVC